MKSKEVLLAIASGILLVLIFPKFNIEILAWIAFVPLIIGIEKKDLKTAFWLGWLTGVIYFLGVVCWVINTMVNYGGLPFFVSALILLVLALYLGIYVAFFTTLVNLFRQKMGISIVFSAPVLWVGLEYVRAHIFSGFPWASLGYSQFKTLSVIQIADITSVYGISFLIILVNVSIAYVLINFLNKTEQKVDYPAIIKPILISGLAVLVCLGYGFWRLKSASTDHLLPSAKIALLQGNIDQSIKWDTAYQDFVYNTYRELTLAAAEQKPDLIIWPETAVPFYFQSDKKYRPSLLELARESGRYLLFGSPAYKFQEKDYQLYNRAYLLSPQGEELGRYDKIHLVPYGEYVPLKNLFPFINKMVESIGDFAHGDDYTVLTIPQGRFGTLICFEIIFPDLVRRFVKNGAQFMVTITNDAWFGKSAASYQHISMAAFRAVENRVPLVRSANTGISGFITPFGEIEKETDLFVRDYLIGKIYLRDESTFYTKYGDVFAFFCLGLTIIWGSMCLLKRSKM